MGMKKKDGATIDGAVVEVTLSKPVDKNNVRFAQQQQLLNPLQQQQQLLGIVDPAELNLLQALNGMASPHSSIPAFTHTLTFTDPASNLQYQIANPHFAAATLPMSHIPGSQLQPSILSQGQMLVGISNLLQDQGGLISGSKPGGRMRATAGSRGAGGVHRPVYYNSAKGVTGGGVKRQLSGEDALHDFYNGVKPVPMLPLNTNGFVKYAAKPPTQVSYFVFTDLILFKMDLFMEKDKFKKYFQNCKRKKRNNVISFKLCLKKIQI